MWLRIIALGIVTCLIVPANLMRAQDSEPTESSTRILGFDAPYAKVYRKNHPQGRSVSVYNLSSKVFEGRVFLCGQNSPENPSQFYMYALDSIELFTFPNPDYQEPPRLDPVQIAKLSISEQVRQSRNRVESKRQNIENLERESRQKQKQLRILKSKLVDADDDAETKLIQTELDLLTEEIGFINQQLDQ